MEMNAHHSAVAKRLPEIEARAWAFAQRASVFGYAEVQVEISISAETSQKIVRRWLEEGRIKVRVGGSKGGRKMFELTAEYREPKDRTSLIAQQLWTAARGLKKFTPVDLAAHCRADLKAELREASAYCQALLRGGYLKVIRTAVPGQREATYQLVRNSGPRAPREKRVTAIWDPNEAAYAFVSGVGRVERAR
jgi:hypothetical protein